MKDNIEFAAAFLVFASFWIYCILHLFRLI